jgi:hypothetical protein
MSSASFANSAEREIVFLTVVAIITSTGVNKSYPSWLGDARSFGQIRNPNSPVVVKNE